MIKHVIRAAVGLLLCLAASAPAAGAQAAPKVVAKPGGVYEGKASVKARGIQCGSRCRIRLLVSSDGLEVTDRSFADPAASCFDGYVYTVLIRPDGTFRTDYNGSPALDLRGTFSRDGRTVKGRGRALCDIGRNRRELPMTFALKLRRQVPPPARGTVVVCERLDELPKAKMILAVVRDVGCGQAREAARQASSLAGCATLFTLPGGACSAAGLACRATSAGSLDPPAQVVCASPAAPGAAAAPIAELVRFSDCPGVGSMDIFTWAIGGLGCKAVDTAAENCDFLQGQPCSAGGFACAAVPGPAFVARTQGAYARCTATANPRLVFEAAYLPGDVA